MKVVSSHNQCGVKKVEKNNSDRNCPAWVKQNSTEVNEGRGCCTECSTKTQGANLSYCAANSVTTNGAILGMRCHIHTPPTLRLAAQMQAAQSGQHFGRQHPGLLYDMDPEEVNEELQGLTQIDKRYLTLVKTIKRVCSIKGGQMGYRGHTLNMAQDVATVTTSLPRLGADISVPSVGSSR